MRVKQLDLGIHNDITIEDYHADSSAISASGLKHFMRSPAHYEHWLNTPPETKPHLDFGNAFELYLLDPEGFRDKVFVLDDETVLKAIGGARPKSTKQYKEWLAVEMQKAAGQYVIPFTGPESLETIQAMHRNIMRDQVLAALCENIEYQATCVWKDPSGVLCKTRPDICHINQRVVVDVKSCRDASPRGFRRQALDYDYGMQAAMQIRGVLASGLMESVEAYYYLTSEKQEPNNAQLYRLDAEDIAIGQATLTRQLELLAQWRGGNLQRNGYNYNAADQHGVLPLQLGEYYWNSIL